MALVKYNSFEELLDQLALQTNLNNTLKLGDYEVSGINDSNRNHFTTLLKNNILIFDYTPTKITNFNYTRFNFSAFIKLSHIYELAHQISSLGYFVGIHDSNTSHIYKNGIHKTWNTSDFLTSFKLDFNELGNPMIKKLEHIWDYGNDIELLKKMLNSDEKYEEIRKNYAEITVIAESFDPNHNDSKVLEKMVSFVTNTVSKKY